VEGSGGTVVGEKYLHLRNSNVTELIEAILSTEAELIQRQPQEWQQSLVRTTAQIYDLLAALEPLVRTAIPQQQVMLLQVRDPG
jgi:ABC-type anion transport system duplicated permease subunit